MAWTTPGTAVTGGTFTAAQYNAWDRDNMAALNPLDSVGGTSWSPTLRATTLDPSVASVTGRYWRVGPVVVAMARIVLDGPSGGGTGTYYAALPIASSGLTSDSASGQAIGGGCTIFDSTASLGYIAVPFLSGASEVRFQLDGAAAPVTHSTPITWDQNDVLSFLVVYMAA